jgi:cellobiose-specific phosphotransferase system component IIA
VARYVYRIYGLLENASDEAKKEAFESLKSLGREYLELFIKAARKQHKAHDVAQKLVETLAEDQDMALILNHLKDHQWLVTVVRDRGWASAARDILLEGIRGDCPCRLGVWLETLLSLKDPTTYPDILAFFSKHGDEESYRLLKAMPEVGLQYEHVLSAWNAQWNDKKNTRYKSFLVVALENGIVTAIDGVARFYNEMGKEKSDADKEIYSKIVSCFDVDLSGQEFWAWFHRNKHRLEFDVQKQKWRVSDRKD